MSFVIIWFSKFSFKFGFVTSSVFVLCLNLSFVTIWWFMLSHNFSFWVLSIFKLLSFVTNWFYFYFVTIKFFLYFFLVIQKQNCEQKEWEKTENCDKIKKMCEEEKEKNGKKLGANERMVFYKWSLLCPIHKAREGGPMTGLELIMWPEGQWDALKKNPHDGAKHYTDRQTDGQTWRLLDQLGPEGRFCENQEKNMVNLENTSAYGRHKKKLNRRTIKNTNHHENWASTLMVLWLHTPWKLSAKYHESRAQILMRFASKISWV